MTPTSRIAGQAEPVTTTPILIGLDLGCCSPYRTDRGPSTIGCTALTFGYCPDGHVAWRHADGSVRTSRDRPSGLAHGSLQPAVPVLHAGRGPRLACQVHDADRRRGG